MDYYREISEGSMMNGRNFKQINWMDPQNLGELLKRNFSLSLAFDVQKEAEIYCCFSKNKEDSLHIVLANEGRIQIFLIIDRKETVFESSQGGLKSGDSRVMTLTQSDGQLDLYVNGKHINLNPTTYLNRHSLVFDTEKRVEQNSVSALKSASLQNHSVYISLLR